MTVNTYISESTNPPRTTLEFNMTLNNTQSILDGIVRRYFRIIQLSDINTFRSFFLQALTGTTQVSNQQVQVTLFDQIDGKLLQASSGTSTTVTAGLPINAYWAFNNSNDVIPSSRSLNTNTQNIIETLTEQFHDPNVVGSSTTLVTEVTNIMPLTVNAAMLVQYTQLNDPANAFDIKFRLTGQQF